MNRCRNKAFNYRLFTNEKIIQLSEIKTDRITFSFIGLSHSYIEIT